MREIRLTNISLPAPVAAITDRTREHWQFCVEKLLDTFVALKQVIPQILFTDKELEHYWWDKEAEQLTEPYHSFCRNKNILTGNAADSDNSKEGLQLPHAVKSSFALFPIACEEDHALNQRPSKTASLWSSDQHFQAVLKPALKMSCLQFRDTVSGLLNSRSYQGSSTRLEQ